MIPMVEPETLVTLESPGGLIRVKAECRDGKCRNVTFDNVPSFVFGLDLPVDVPGIGKLTVDVAYGGMIYVLVDAQALGFSIKPDEARQLVDAFGGPGVRGHRAAPPRSRRTRPGPPPRPSA